MNTTLVSKAPSYLPLCTHGRRPTCTRGAKPSSAMSFGVPMQRSLELRLYGEALGARAHHSELIAA